MKSLSYPPLILSLVLFNTKQTIKEQKEILEAMKTIFKKEKSSAAKRNRKAWTMAQPRL